MYITRVILCLFSALSRRIGVLQIAVIIIPMLPSFPAFDHSATFQKMKSIKSKHQDKTIGYNNKKGFCLMPLHTCVTSVPEIEVYISRCGREGGTGFQTRSRGGRWSWTLKLTQKRS